MTVGAIPYAVICLGIFSLILMVFGFVVDYALIIDNQIANDPQLPYSQHRADTMGLLANAFKAMGFVGTLTVVVFLIMNGVQRESGEI